MSNRSNRASHSSIIRLIALVSLACLALVGASGSGPARAQIPTTATASASNILMLRLYYRDRAEYISLANEFGLEEAQSPRGYLLMPSDQATLDELLARGQRVEIDRAETDKINANPPIFGHNPDTFWGGYHTVEEMEAFLDQRVAQYPTLAQKVDYGDSWCKLHPGSCTQPNTYNGYDLYALRITNQNIPGPKPVFWLNTGLHARELVPPEISIKYINWLLDGYNTNADARWMVDHHEIWIVPMSNPDAHHIAENGAIQPRTQRKNANNTNGCSTWPPTSGSQFGTDLNRNFEFKWGCCGGSSPLPCNLTYRGPVPASEPETQAITAKRNELIADQRGLGDNDPAPITTTGAFIDMHSNARLTLYPWGQTFDPAPNSTDLRNIAKHMSAPSLGGNGYHMEQSVGLYPTDGASDDAAYGDLGAASFTIELNSGGSFWPSYSVVETDWNANRAALIHITKISRMPYLMTRGPDTNLVTATPMTVTQGTPSNLTSTINYNWAHTDPPEANSYLQNVAAAEYYIDTPPWAGGLAIPMQAADGNYDSPTEAVQATVQTGSLAPGRHVLMVRGRGVSDYSGYQSWGAISATFLDVLPSGGTSTPTSVTITNTPQPTQTATTTQTPPPTQSISTSTATPQATPTCSPGGGPYDIAIVFSDDAAPGKLIDYILAEPDVASVVPVDARFSTPNLATLLAFDEVVVYSNTEYDDPVALGNVIADYQDAGGIVVATNANWWGPPYGLEGRWMTGGYTMFTYPAPANNSTSTLGDYDPTEPLMQDVITLTAFFRNQVTLTSGATQVAAWADDLPLVAYKATNGHTAVGINAYLGFPEEGWDGDFGTLIVNAARWLKPGVPCVSATATATPANATATATACVIQFTDVPADHTFYASIRCLACLQILSGYTSGCETGDPCFRPGNNVTRGQISKIVSNAAGFSDPVSGQTFEDVPPGSTFYEFVERLAGREVMTGYPCGGPGEPCNPPDNRPYFRPNGTATRGQLAKIVSNAAGFNEPVTGQTFEDVPPGHTFYDFVERLATRGVMSGYACGGLAEPCVPPDNRPYFRPNANVTRGQTTKIVANTFFPECNPPRR